MPPVREVPAVQMAESLEQSKASIGPMVLMSGYLTKKTRSRNRWIRRWWQLLDNGMLIYFQSDKREKLLGEIDIGHTCYDVRHGAKSVDIAFPRVAPKCCCFSFSVLKRTYYMYAPTAAEAKKWSESIHGVSNVLNRRVVAGVARRKAPDPPGPPRPPSCPPNFRISMTPLDFSQHYNISSANSLGDVHAIKLKDDSSNYLRRRSRKEMRMASSVPDYLDRVGFSPTPPSSPFGSPSSRLWLDGSPPPEPTLFCSPTKSVTSPIVAVAGKRSDSISTYSHKDSVSSPYSPDAVITSSPRTPNLVLQANPERTVSPLWQTTRRRHSLPESFIKEFDRLEKKEQMIKQRLQSLGIPPRPASVATYPKSCYTYQPHPQPRPRHHYVPGAVQVIPVQMSAGALRHKTFSKSTDSLSNPPEQEREIRRASIGYKDAPTTRPVPKPRKSKGTTAHRDQPSKPKRNSKVTFSEQTHILNASSPTGSDNSVSLSTGLIVANPVTSEVAIDDLPPPRPRKDSGPPTFVPPPPPPIEEKHEAVP